VFVAFVSNFRIVANALLTFPSDDFTPNRGKVSLHLTGKTATRMHFGNHLSQLKVTEGQ